MSLEFTVEVWEILRPHIDVHERRDAADTLVNLLIENNYEAADIKEAFRGNKEILTALKDYANQQESEEEFEDDDADEDYDYEDE